MGKGKCAKNECGSFLRIRTGGFSQYLYTHTPTHLRCSMHTCTVTKELVCMP
jgi:hypothetical protein